MNETLLQIKNLGVQFKTPAGVFNAVDDVSFDIARGKTMALVGESGSGKSVTALSTLQLLPYPLAQHTPQSSIMYEGEELVGKPEGFMRKIRGAQVGMIFQEPQSALNPLHTIEKQIGEILELHQNMRGAARNNRILELLDMVELSQMRERLGAYPHELSGGQRQRVMIAMALANNPELLIADEPTTALDVTVQAQVLELLDKLKAELNMAMLLITHDLSIVEKMADHTCVMRHGKLIEYGETQSLYNAPKDDYTKMLINARPSGIATPIKADAPIVLDGQNIHVKFPKSKNFFGKVTSIVHAVNDISITAKQGETIGVVGESGSGKSTLGLALLRLLKSEGTIVYNGRNIADLDKKALRDLRADMQIVFQDPYGSLSPRMSVGQIIGEGLALHRPELSDEQREELIISALNDVHMDPETRHRYPHEFSGGQRQRISIARAMVLRPKFVVLDEPTSALDVSVQTEVVDLLRELQERYTLTYVFISHDLRVVRAMAHHLVVMKDGQVVESGAAADIFDAPKQDYTKLLLNAALNLKASA